MVVVHNSELLGEADNSTGTSGCELGSELREEIFSGCLSSRWSGTANVPAEDLGGEFTVLESTGSVLIVNAVESVQILDKNKIKIKPLKKASSLDPSQYFKPTQPHGEQHN